MWRLKDSAARVWVSLGLSLASAALVWWAVGVFDEGQRLMASTFEFPNGHVAAMQVLLAGSGACFALVLAIGNSSDSTRATHLLVAGIPALAAVALLWIWASPMPIPFQVVNIVVSAEVTALAPFVVGFTFLSAWLRGRSSR